MEKRIGTHLVFLAALIVSVSVFGQTIRLVSPLNNGVGRIEVFYNGTWGTVCDDSFGADEAKVACNQLGRYKSGLTPSAIQRFGFGGGKIWLDGVSCSGTESSLASCSHNTWGVNDCSHSEDVGIICDPSDITMKLTPSYHKGLLRVYHSGRWGTVCDDGFGQVEASVVCRALGYQGGKVIDESSSIPMWLDDVQCTMRNTDLKDCKHRPWGSDDCSDSEAVGVQCFSFPEDSTAARLVSTTNTPGEGLLELYHGGQWGRVCYTGFRVEEATVVCRMLGHNTFGALASSHLNTGSSSRHVILDKVKCLGTELSLNECLHYPWGSVTCSSTVVRIQCTSADLQIRLNSTTRGRGRVEVLHNNVWGTVCRGSSFSSQEAQVVCKMANLPRTTASVTTSYGPGEGIIWLSNVDCTGTETSLDQCSHSGWGTAMSCSHSSDVGVVCHGVSGPVIHLEPPGSVLNVLLGQVISVVCVVDYSNFPVTSFRWTHNGHPYSGQTFSKTVTSKSDSGSLTCSVGNVHTSTRINVWYPTVVHLEPQNDTLDVGVGEDLSVQCVVDDVNPSAHTFQWSHNGQTSTGSTFLKRNITKSDQGELICTADNGHMVTTGRAVATVNVRYPPEIHLSPRQDVISAMAGDAVEVECVVDDANPAVTSYTWCHNDNISHGQTFMKHLSPDDAGNLSCSATNEQGTSTVQASINVLQVSSLIGSDDTTSQNKPIAIVTGSVGIVTIIILIIIIIHLRRRLHAAKPEHEPKRSEQTSRADEIPARRCNYETVERPSGGAENTYCEVGLSQTTGKERKVRSPKGQAYNDDGNPAHVYGNNGFEDEENIRKKKGTASGTNYDNIQLEMSEDLRKKKGKERKVRSPKGQAFNDEPVYQNTTSTNQSSI